MRTCEICQRGPLRGNLVSHSNAKTIHRQKLNLQNRKINGKRMLVCTSCLRTLVKPKAR